MKNYKGKIKKAEEKAEAHGNTEIEKSDVRDQQSGVSYLILNLQDFIS